MQQRVNSEMATHPRENIHSGERQLTVPSGLAHFPNVNQSFQGKQITRKQRAYDESAPVSTAMDQTADSNDQDDQVFSNVNESANGQLNRGSNQIESDGQLLNRQKFIAKSSLTDLKNTNAAHKSNIIFEEHHINQPQFLAFDNGSLTDMKIQKQREIDRIIAAQHFDDAQKRILVRKAQRMDSLTSPLKRAGGKFTQFSGKNDNRYQKTSFFEGRYTSGRDASGMKTPTIQKSSQSKGSRFKPVHNHNVLAMSYDSRKVNTPGFQDQDAQLLEELDMMKEGYYNRNSVKVRRSQNESNLDSILFSKSKSSSKKANLKNRLKSPVMAKPSKSPRMRNTSVQKSIFRNDKLPSIQEKTKPSRFKQADHGQNYSSGPLENITSPQMQNPGRIRNIPLDSKIPKNDPTRTSSNLAQKDNTQNILDKNNQRIKTQPSGLSNHLARSSQGSQPQSKGTSGKGNFQKDPSLDKNGFPSRKSTAQNVSRESGHEHRIRTECEICHAKAAGLIPEEFEERGPTVDHRNYDWDYNGRKQPKIDSTAQNTTTLSGDQPVKVSELLDTVGSDSNKRQILATSGRFFNKSTIGNFSSIETANSKKNPNRQGQTYSSQQSVRRTLEQQQQDPAKTSLSVTGQDHGVITPDPQVIFKLKEKHGENLIVEHDFNKPLSQNDYDENGNAIFRNGSSQGINNESKRHSVDNAARSKSSQRNLGSIPGGMSNISQMKLSQHRRSSNMSGSAAKRLMEGLTNGQAMITDDTVLLINGGEVLRQDGVKGDIAEVGLGFGTGRHTASRELYASKSPPRPPIVRAGTPIEKTPIDEKTPRKNDQQTSMSVNKPQTPEAFRAKASTYSKADQTSSHLMYNHKNLVQNETATDPIVIMRTVNKQTAMVQTDALPEEPDSDDDGGNPVMRPKSHNYAKRNMRRSQQGMRPRKNESTHNDTSEFPVATPVLPKLDITSSEEEIKDWNESKIFMFIKLITVKTLIKKGILEAKDDISPPNNYKGLTKNKMEQLNLNPNGHQIWTKDEVNYYTNLLRDMPDDSPNFKKDQCAAYLETAKTTIEVLIANMVVPFVMSRNFFKNHSEPNKDNVLKLLFRARKLYDAKDNVINVLKAVYEVDSAMRPGSNVWRVLQDSGKRDKMEPQYQNLLENHLRLISRTLGLIDTFKKENKLYKKMFLFKGSDYTLILLQYAAATNGFMELRQLDGCYIEASGYLTFECERTDEQVAYDKGQYDFWFSKSLKVTGQMPLPDLIQPSTSSEPSQKQSRVAQAISAVPGDKPKKEDKKPTIRDIGQLPEDSPEESEHQYGVVFRCVPKWYDDEYDEDGNVIEKVIEKEEDKNAKLRAKREAENLARKQREYDLYIANLPGHPGYDGPVVAPHSPKHIDEEIGLPRVSLHVAQEEFEALPNALNMEGEFEPTVSKVLPPLSPSHDSKPMLKDLDFEVSSQNVQLTQNTEFVSKFEIDQAYGTKLKLDPLQDERDINGLPVHENRKGLGTGYRSRRDMISEGNRSEFTLPYEVSCGIDQASAINVLSDN